MARFSGRVGFAVNTETAPDVWKDVLTEYPYFGDIIRNSFQIREGEYLNDDLSVSHSVSIVADPYAREHFDAIRYVVLETGVAWKVTEVIQEHPRLQLRLGGVYNGERPTSI